MIRPSDMAGNGLTSLAALFTQSDVVDQVEGAVRGSQVTGWQVLAAIAVLVLASPVGNIVQRPTMTTGKEAIRQPPRLFDKSEIRVYRYERTRR